MFRTLLSPPAWALPALAMALCLSAATPDFIPYQGYLTDSTGAPVSASLELQFRLYDQAEGGSPLWQETHAAVAVVAGFFHVELGNHEPLADGLFSGPLFLGLTVAGESEMSPRMRIGSVPFARISAGVLACAVGETNCGGVCADLQNSVVHCGQCGQACAPGQLCVEGSCTECTEQTWYRDNDGDGYGQCGDSIQACTASGAYTALVCGDCDDNDPAINPGATEICADGIDNSCNGLIDCEDPACPGGGSGGLDFCDGICRDLTSDHSHCGACFIDCGGPDTQCAAFFCASSQCGVSYSTGNACDDGNACTFGGSCDGMGNCAGASPVDCDDANECTVDSCDPVTGCVNQPVADGTPCTGGICQSGSCVSP